MGTFDPVQGLRDHLKAIDPPCELEPDDAGLRASRRSRWLAVLAGSGAVLLVAAGVALSPVASVIQDGGGDVDEGSSAAPSAARMMEVNAAESRMQAALRRVVGGRASQADASMEASTPKDLSIQSFQRDQPAELNLKLQGARGRHWRLYISDERKQDNEPEATCRSKLESGWFRSCEVRTIAGIRVVVSVAALPPENFAGTDDGPKDGFVRYDRQVFTVEGDGPIVAFHEVVDAPPGAETPALFETAVLDAVNLVTDPDIVGLK